MQRKNIILIGIALLFAVPYLFVEYRRIVGGVFDILYWLVAALLIVTAICVYKILANVFADKRGEQRTEEERSTLRTNLMAVTAFIIAAYAFLVSGAINLIFM